jgi:hypothetical protein
MTPGGAEFLARVMRRRFGVSPWAQSGEGTTQIVVNSSGLGRMTIVTTDGGGRCAAAEAMIGLYAKRRDTEA